MDFQHRRQFLQVPGPTNVPARVLEAIARPTIDHRSADFSALGSSIISDISKVFKTSQTVLIFPSSGTGAWEAALVNTLSPGDHVLAFETGHFAALWAEMARDFGLKVTLVPGDWRSGVDPSVVYDVLHGDQSRAIRAVMVVHNETSTGVTSRIHQIRAAIDRAEHPALFLVDTISSLTCMDFRHDEWGVDVAVSGSQKGLMLPPGLGFNAVSEKAMEASRRATLPKSYWRWDRMVEYNRDGFFPYTPATNLLFGLRTALDMIFEEGLDQVFARHRRHGEATRAAVTAWGLDIVAQNPEELSASLTAVLMPEGHDETSVRTAIAERFGMPLGAGLGRLRGRAFRIGHLGDFDDLSLIAVLAGVELGLARAGVPHHSGGVQAALGVLGT